ncbi:hypothetical protein CONLIGDRAFT_339124 [Coniochaeta ligniaria NRRL 30616]|uniref:Uncharacterized protein n=1 Tax=Coniochaeta ligniaria NRRL 30616 TaxID=1408157 RepID=A0A1J7JK79_9PEZI|nr:hypothetical protein CONLIGDRAFT_339124 [Coniochaeta ligniaria NRRL 30616]
MRTAIPHSEANRGSRCSCVSRTRGASAVAASGIAVRISQTKHSNHSVKDQKPPEVEYRAIERCVQYWHCKQSMRIAIHIPYISVHITVICPIPELATSSRPASLRHGSDTGRVRKKKWKQEPELAETMWVDPSGQGLASFLRRWEAHLAQSEIPFCRSAAVLSELLYVSKDSGRTKAEIGTSTLERSAILFKDALGACLACGRVVA